ncbi:MAG: hypothetical protein OXU19_01455 [bacterium]|nr:hypothetical protein [bacterium]
MCEGSSLIELFDQFPDDVSAECWFEDQHWPDERFCLRFCGSSGGVASGDETVEFLTSAGFTSAKQIPLTGVYAIVTAAKP